MPLPPLYNNLKASDSSPAVDAVAVTPNDGADLPTMARSLYIGAAGNVVVTTANGTQTTFVGLPAGYILPLFVKRVWATNTTATSIVAMY